MTALRVGFLGDSYRKRSFTRRYQHFFRNPKLAGGLLPTFLDHSPRRCAARAVICRSRPPSLLWTYNWPIVLLIPKTIGNRKRDCAWGCAWGINTTWENLQIEKHKSVRWAERTPSWFVLFDLQIFSGGVYSPSTTSRTISFSISNSFWY